MIEQPSKNNKEKKKLKRSSISLLQWGGRQDNTRVVLKKFYSLETSNTKGSYRRWKNSILTDRWINTKVKNPNAVKDY